MVYPEYLHNTPFLISPILIDITCNSMCKNYRYLQFYRGENCKKGIKFPPIYEELYVTAVAVVFWLL